MPRPGAANGVVPKNGIGMAFWIEGVPGKADMVKVAVPRTIAAGIRRRGMPAGSEQLLRHRRQHEESDEQADAAIGNKGTCQTTARIARLFPSFFSHEIGDSIHGAAVLHQLAEQRAKQE